MAQGKKIDWTPELEARLLDAKRSGLSVRDQARFIGVSHESVRNHVKDCPGFAARYHEAEVDEKKRLLDVVRKGGHSDPHLAAKYLRLRWPDEFAESREHWSTADVLNLLGELADATSPLIEAGRQAEFFANWNRATRVFFGRDGSPDYAGD